MGATTFMISASGKSADEAFNTAVSEARYMNGHGGYTGTIAEKGSFREFKAPAGVEPAFVAEYATTRWLPDTGVKPETLRQLDVIADAVDDKWGPAGCVQLSASEWLFFGWASE